MLGNMSYTIGMLQTGAAFVVLTPMTAGGVFSMLPVGRFLRIKCGQTEASASTLLRRSRRSVCCQKRKVYPYTMRLYRHLTNLFSLF
jgi:hypothetical protein